MSPQRGVGLPAWDDAVLVVLPRPVLGGKADLAVLGVGEAPRSMLRSRGVGCYEPATETECSASVRSGGRGLAMKVGGGCTGAAGAGGPAGMGFGVGGRGGGEGGGCGASWAV